MPGPKGSVESKKVIQARRDKFDAKLERSAPKHVLEANTPKKVKAKPTGPLSGRPKKVLTKSESVKRFSTKKVKYDSAQKVINDVVSLLESKIQSFEYQAPKVVFLHDLIVEVVQRRCEENPELDFQTLLASNIKQFCGAPRALSTHLYLEERISNLINKLIDEGDPSFDLDIAVGRDDGIAKWKVHGLEVSAMRHTPIILYTVPLYSESNPNLSGAVISL